MRYFAVRPRGVHDASRLGFDSEGMSMKTALFVLIAAAMLTANANAQTIQGLSGSLNSDVTKLPGLNQVMSDMTDANVQLKKENDLYISDQKQKNEWVKSAVAEQQRTVKAPIDAKVNAVAEDYNSHCAENRVGKLPPDQYNACVQWKSRADQDITALQQQWTDYAAKWDAQNVKPINVVIAKQNVRMAQIATLVKANFKRFLDAQDSFIAIRKRIGKTLALLRRLCDPATASSADTPFTKGERAKFCSSLDFDGFDRSLPPMYKSYGTGGVTPNSH